jgi:hypothetical protein
VPRIQSLAEGSSSWLVASTLVLAAVVPRLRLGPFLWADQQDQDVLLEAICQAHRVSGQPQTSGYRVCEFTPPQLGKLLRALTSRLLQLLGNGGLESLRRHKRRPVARVHQKSWHICRGLCEG